VIYANYVDFRTVWGTGVDAPDGMKVFDSANVVGSINPFTSWAFTLPATITVPFSTTDAVPFVDEYDWYLTETRSTPALYIVRNDPGGGVTWSGRVSLGLTAVGSSIVAVQDAGKIDILFRGAYLYARDTSGNIYVCDLHRSAFASESIT